MGLTKTQDRPKHAPFAPMKLPVWFGESQRETVGRAATP
jgi:hypothetical protein